MINKLLEKSIDRAFDYIKKYNLFYIVNHVIWIASAVILTSGYLCQKQILGISFPSYDFCLLNNQVYSLLGCNAFCLILFFLIFKMVIIKCIVVWIIGSPNSDIIIIKYLSIAYTLQDVFEIVCSFSLVILSVESIYNKDFNFDVRLLVLQLIYIGYEVCAYLYYENIKFSRRIVYESTCYLDKNNKRLIHHSWVKYYGKVYEVKKSNEITGFITKDSPIIWELQASDGERVPLDWAAKDDKGDLTLLTG